MIYSQKTTQERKNISRFESDKLKKLQASKPTQWMIAGIVK